MHTFPRATTFTFRPTGMPTTFLASRHPPARPFRHSLTPIWGPVLPGVFGSDETDCIGSVVGVRGGENSRRCENTESSKEDEGSHSKGFVWMDSEEIDLDRCCDERLMWWV